MQCSDLPVFYPGVTLPDNLNYIVGMTWPQQLAPCAIHVARHARTIETLHERIAQSVLYLGDISRACFQMSDQLYTHPYIRFCTYLLVSLGSLGAIAASRGLANVPQLLLVRFLTARQAPIVLAVGSDKRPACWQHPRHREIVEHTEHTYI